MLTLLFLVLLVIYLKMGFYEKFDILITSYLLQKHSHMPKITGTYRPANYFRVKDLFMQIMICNIAKN